MLNHKNLQKIFVERGCSQIENCLSQLMDRVAFDWKASWGSCAIQNYSKTSQNDRRDVMSGSLRLQCIRNCHIF